MYDFNSLPEGESTASELGFWVYQPSLDTPVTVDGGRVTIENNTWGAFPGLTPDQYTIFAGKTGLALYFKTGDSDATVCFGFNDNTGANHVLATEGEILLEATDGTVTTIELEDVIAYSQGGFTVPADFEGYIYLPFTSWRDAAIRDNVFDYENKQIATIIYAVAYGVPVTYGEVLAYTGTYTPADPTEAPTDPGSDTADISTVTYAFAAAVSLGSLTVLRKKR